MASRSLCIIVLVAVEILCSVVASSEQRLGASRLYGFSDSASVHQLAQKQHRQLTLETCAERMMSNDDFLECVRDDNFYTEDCGGALLQRTSDWCNLDGRDVCCGDSISCCEVSAAGKAVGTLLFVFIALSLILCSCACCRCCPLYRHLCFARLGRKIAEQGETVCLSPEAGTQDDKNLEN